MSRTLLQRNTRYLSARLPLLLFLCSIMFYVAMRMQAHHMQQKQLLLKQYNVWNSFAEARGNIQKHITGEYDIQEVTLNAIPGNDELGDTSLYYPDKQKSLPFQMLIGQKILDGKNYRITTWVSSTEISHLIIKVFISEVILLLLLLGAILVLNSKSAGLLWQSFFATLKKVKAFDMNSNSLLQLPAETGTNEFNELNKVVNELIGKVNITYQNQKQFVENASHEMQTPLAVIRSKLELLINQPAITEKSASLLSDITEANDRLSQMNRTLLLLAKIENNQFPDTEDIDISAMLMDNINNLKGYYDAFPVTETAVEKKIIIHANHSLIEILLSNLIKNAIEHNVEQGQIKLQLSSSTLSIKNTGLPPEVNTQDLFERFKKGSYQSKTTGLGLALVKQICTLYHYPVYYYYDNGWHTVTVHFQ